MNAAYNNYAQFYEQYFKMQSQTVIICLASLLSNSFIQLTHLCHLAFCELHSHVGLVFYVVGLLILPVFACCCVDFCLPLYTTLLAILILHVVYNVLAEVLLCFSHFQQHRHSHRSSRTLQPCVHLNHHQLLLLLLIQIWLAQVSVCRF